MAIAASLTQPMKLAGSLSYRVATRRNCFSLLKKRSMRSDLPLLGNPPRGVRRPEGLESQRANRIDEGCSAQRNLSEALGGNMVATQPRLTPKAGVTVSSFLNKRKCVAAPDRKFKTLAIS